MSCPMGAILRLRLVFFFFFLVRMLNQGLFPPFHSTLLRTVFYYIYPQATYNFYVSSQQSIVCLEGQSDRGTSYY